MMIENRPAMGRAWENPTSLDFGKTLQRQIGLLSTIFLSIE